jgi:hypothetical protein
MIWEEMTYRGIDNIKSHNCGIEAYVDFCEFRSQNIRANGGPEKNLHPV